jgi:hypothetical protein
MTEILRADQLEVGDLVVGPDSRVVRVELVVPMDDDTVVLRSTDPDAERSHEFVIGERLDGRGQARAKQFVVLARGVPKDAVQIDGLG